jgi:hypothetical protein
MASNDIRNKTASIYIDDQPAIDAYNRLIPKADAYNKKIDEGTKKAKFLEQAIQKSLDAGGKPEALQKKLSNVNKELDNSRKALEKVNAQQKELQQRMNNGVGPSIKEQTALVRKLENEYLNLGNNTEAAKNKLLEFGKASSTLKDMRARLDDIKKVQNESSGGFAKIFGRVAEYFTAYTIISKGAEAIKDFFTDSIKEAQEAEQANARFKATLDNLGKTDAFDRLEASADRFHQRFKNIDDDEVVSVFEKLIDYGKLTEDQMNRLIPVIVDFAAKQRISIGEATDVITKSLEGNGKALKTYGISLAEASTPAERFNIIMTDLKGKVDGANDAFLKTTEGGMAAAKQEFKDLKEEVGNGLLPVLNNVLNFFVKAAEGLPILATKIKNTVGDIFTAFTKGPFAARAQINEREAQEWLKAEERNAQKFVDAFADKGIPDITAEIVKLQNRLSLRNAQSLLPGLDKKTLDAAKSDIRQINLELKGLYQLQDSKGNTAILGTGDPNYDPEKAKEAARKRAAEQKKILDDRKRFLEELRKLDVEYGLINLSDYDKEVAQAIEKYNALKELAHGNAGDLRKLEEDLGQALLQIRVKYSKKELDEVIRRDEEALKERRAMLDKALKNGVEQLNRIENELRLNATKANQKRLDELNLQLLQSSGRKKLQAQLALLKEQERQELQQTDLTESKKALIEEEYRQKKRDAEKEFYIQLAQTFLSVAEQLAEIGSLIGQAKTNKENAELDKEKKNNDDRKKSYDTLLNRKLISQQQYNQKQAALDDAYNKKAAEIKKKQFIRQQKADVIAAEISTAQAILSALTTKPFLVGLGLAVLAGIKGAAQVKEIKSRPVPEFGIGGELTGPSHKNGGMPVINPRTGRKEAEVEGGEVILSRNTVQNNKPVVDALLYSSMNRNGATILPWFKSRSYKGIDFGGISRSISNVRHYESGGTFSSPASISTDTAQQPVIVPAMTEQQEALMRQLLITFSRPIKASVVYQDIKDADATINQIKQDVTFAKK